MNNTFKKIIICFLACMMLVCTLPLSVRADDSVLGKEITFEVEFPYNNIYPDPPYWNKDVWIGHNLPTDSIGCFMRWGSSDYALLVCSLEGGDKYSFTSEKYVAGGLSSSYSGTYYWGEHNLDIPDVINPYIYTCGYMEQGSFHDYCTYTGWDCSVVGETYEDCLTKVYLYMKDGTVSEGMTTVDNVENELPSDLGYLDDVFVKYLFKYGENYSVGTEEDINRICFSQYSTTGVDLLSGSYTIRLYEKFSVYKRSDPDVDIYPDLPLVLIGEYSPKDLFIDYNSIDAMARTSSVTGDVDGFNSWNIVIKQLIRNDNIYLQIVHKTTSGDICGGYLCFNGTAKDDEDSLSTMTTLNPDLTVDTSDGGFVDKNYETTQGVGVDYEEAEHNADKHYQEVQNGGGGVSSSINDIVSQVGNMPQVIGKLFSFLPPWCLAFVGIAIGLWVTLMIIKAIRG